jgi:hypothetical protein
MEHMKKDRTYRKTLKYINKFRKQNGDPPLDEILCGEPGNSKKCAFANSIAQAILVLEECMSTRNDDTEEKLYAYHRHPKYVKKFIKAFDDYKYPDLVIDNWAALGWSEKKSEPERELVQ